MIRVVAAAILREGRVMLMRRAPGQKLEGGWEFPGGKVEPGEEDGAALERELFEELGIYGKTGDFVAENAYDYPFGRILLCLYRFDWQTGAVNLTVHDKVEWADRSALLTAALCPADVPPARVLAQTMQ